MRKYSVVWNNADNTRSGCVTVYAKNAMGAIIRAREILQVGEKFRIVRVFEG